MKFIFCEKGEVLLLTMTNDEIINRWLFTFGSGVSEEIMINNVLASCNLMWHIFTWGNAPCATDDEARKAFDDITYDKAIFFNGGYSANDKPSIKDVKIIDKISSADLESLMKGLDDFYIVDINFQWTYVHTHESMIGPFFAVAV